MNTKKEKSEKKIEKPPFSILLGREGISKFVEFLSSINTFSVLMWMENDLFCCASDKRKKSSKIEIRPDTIKKTSVYMYSVPLGSLLNDLLSSTIYRDNLLKIKATPDITTFKTKRFMLKYKTIEGKKVKQQKIKSLIPTLKMHSKKYFIIKNPEDLEKVGPSIMPPDKSL